MIRITVEKKAYSNSWEEVNHPAETVVREYDIDDLHDAQVWFRESTHDVEHLVRAVWEMA